MASGHHLDDSDSKLVARIPVFLNKQVCGLDGH